MARKRASVATQEPAGEPWQAPAPAVALPAAAPEPTPAPPEPEPEPEEEDQEDQEEDQEQPAPARDTNLPKNKSAAVRILLQEDPNISTDEAIAEMLDRWNIEMSKTHFSATKSQIMKKLREDGETTPATRNHYQPAKQEPTLSDLLKVKEILGDRSEEDIAELLDIIELADDVGGLDQLRQCIETLQKLRA